MAPFVAQIESATASLLTSDFSGVFLVCDVLCSSLFNHFVFFLNVESPGAFGEVKLRHQRYQDQSSFELAGTELCSGLVIKLPLLPVGKRDIYPYPR